VDPVVRPPERSSWIAAAAAAAVVAAMYAALLLPDDTVTWLLEEERPIELLGALSLLACAVMLALLWREERRQDGPRARRLVCLGLAGLFFLGFAEEISWGQRILGFGTPESLREINRQDEVNVHNLDVLSGALNANRLFQLFWVALGVLVPVAAAVYRPARERLARLLPVLPLAITAGLVLNQVLTWTGDEVFEGESGLYQSTTFTATYALVEVQEAGVALLLATGFALRYFRARTRG